MPAQRDRNDSIWNTFGFLTKVRYGGVLGKVAAVGIVFMLFLCVLALVAQRFEYLLWGILVIGFLSLILLTTIIRSIFLANPEMATLEGTEVIRYRQNELASKNHSTVRATVVADVNLSLPNPRLTADAVEEES